MVLDEQCSLKRENFNLEKEQNANTPPPIETATDSTVAHLNSNPLQIERKCNLWIKKIKLLQLNKDGLIIT